LLVKGGSLRSDRHTGECFHIADRTLFKIQCTEWGVRSPPFRIRGEGCLRCREGLDPRWANLDDRVGLPTDHYPPLHPQNLPPTCPQTRPQTRSLSRSPNRSPNRARRRQPQTRSSCRTRQGLTGRLRRYFKISRPTWNRSAFVSYRRYADFQHLEPDITIIFTSHKFIYIMYFGNKTCPFILLSYLAEPIRIRKDWPGRAWVSG
jgi:hypothetical protein